MSDTDDLKKYTKRLLFYHRWDQVVLRGCITGMFTAIGVFLGTGIIFFIGSRLLGGLQEIPLINTILEQTRLDVVIENEVRKLTQQEETPTEEPAEETPAAPRQLSYTNADLGIKFTYPDIFESAESKGTTAEPLVQFTGNGSLQTLDIFKGELEVEGKSSQRFVTNTDGQRILIEIYEETGKYNGAQVTNAFFTATVGEEENAIHFVGIASQDAPKLGREIFTSLITTTGEI